MSDLQKVSGVLELLSKLGGAVIGLAAISYVAGHFRLAKMYSALGAEWVMEFVSAHDIIMAGAGMFLMLVVSVLSAIWMIIFLDVKPSRLRLISFICLALGYVGLIVVDSVDCERCGPLTTYNAVFGLSTLIFMAAGFTVVFTVRAYLLDSEYKYYAAGGVAFAFFVGLYSVPGTLGKTWGREALNGEMQMLPLASHEKHGRASWRLVSNVDSKFLLVTNAPGNPAIQFMFADPADGWMIYRSFDVRNGVD